jgi:hypothetical protein
VEEEEEEEVSEEEESESVHEEDDTALSSTPKDGSKTTFQWKEGALDNAANAKPASSSGQKVLWHGFSTSHGLSPSARVSSPSPLPPQANHAKTSQPVITPVPKLATPLFGGFGAQSAGNASSKISTRPKTPPGLFGAEPTTTPAASQSDLQSKNGEYYSNRLNRHSETTAEGPDTSASAIQVSRAARPTQYNARKCIGSQ